MSIVLVKIVIIIMTTDTDNIKDFGNNRNKNPDHKR